jgi:WD40 repeat protein
VAVGYRRRAIGLFDLVTNSHIADLSGHTELPWNMAFSPDGKLLLSSTSAGSLKLWDVGTRRCLASFRDDANGWLMPVSFLPGTSKIVISHQHRGVSIWDLAYYDRHIRGNAEAQIGRLSAKLGESAVAPTRAWVESLGR